MRWMIGAAVLCAMLPMSVSGQRLPRTPASGSAERAAILDVVRPAVERRESGRIVFADVHLAVLDGWAYLRAIPYPPTDETDTAYGGARISCHRCDPFVYALLRRDGAAWGVAALEVGAEPGTTPHAAWSARHGVPGALFRRDRDAEALEAAMREYIDALAARDPERWLALFPRTGPVRLVNSLGPPYVGSATRSELRREIQEADSLGGGWWFGHIDPETGQKDHDYYAEGFDQRGMWRQDTPGLFINPSYPLNVGPRRSHVRWKKEGGRWVVAEICFVAS
jgi:hypothetical protein